MATLKDLLGDAYKEDMSLADVDRLISEKKFADLSSGDYVALGKFKALEKERDSFKDKYTEKLTEEEKNQQLQAEREKHYADIERENSVYKYKAKLMSQIQDEAVATKVAEFMANGDMESAIETQNAYLATKYNDLSTKIKSDLMKQNPQPAPQNPTDNTISKEAFAKMTLAEKQKFYTEHPEQYKNIYN